MKAQAKTLAILMIAWILEVIAFGFAVVHALKGGVMKWDLMIGFCIAGIIAFIIYFDKQVKKDNE